MVATGRFLILTAFSVLCACTLKQAESPRAAIENGFTNPQRVMVQGYAGDLMEPFLSRDGKLLFFNNSNDPKVNTDLFWAERIDDLNFRFKGAIDGVNTPALEGVPSIDKAGEFYFVSPRSYKETASTIYRGRFSGGHVTGVELVPGISIRKPGIVNFDAEISADGNTLYFVESEFRFGSPKTARILIALRSGDHFVRSDDSPRIMQTINTGRLNYAPATSASELEIYFTRLEADGPTIYIADRKSKNAPFGEPRKLAAATGFVEGPTISPDGKSLYYHKKENGRFVLYRVARH